jgi:glucose-1-phosphate thymidylyltransferase
LKVLFKKVCFWDRRKMKGIVLAGGSGTRLRPMTAAVNKHLLPVYDKPMIFYPLATLMQAGIRDILFITSPADTALFQNMFGNGTGLGLTLSYAAQEKPKGIAEALIIAEDFTGQDSVALVLGDNVFYGNGFGETLRRAAAANTGATVFARQVDHPRSFGIVTFDHAGRVLMLEEKPQHPQSNWAVTGLYVYDADAARVARTITPSPRGELEITAVNEAYLNAGTLWVEKLDDSVAWLDTGTADSLLEGANAVKAAEEKTGRKIACLEEIAFEQGFITLDQFMVSAQGYAKTPYGQYVAMRAEAAYEMNNVSPALAG